MYKCLLNRHVSDFHVIIIPKRVTEDIKEEYKLCFAFWKLISQILHIDTLVYVMSAVKIIFKPV